MSIHPSAVIAPGARIPDSCTIGPFCTIGPEVELGEDCTLISHVALDGRTRIGARNTFYPFGAIGMAPQDLKYKGEPTATEIGDGNTIREGVTISRGTTGGGGVTRIGSGNLLMAYAHVGHDSQVGSHCILANSATLAGHVTIEDHVTLGAFCPVHQHCVVGAYSFIGGRNDCDAGCASVLADLSASARIRPSGSIKSDWSGAGFRRNGSRRCRRRTGFCWRRS